MTHRERVRELFDRLIDLSGGERATLLVGEPPGVRDEVESLLEHAGGSPLLIRAIDDTLASQMPAGSIGQRIGPYRLIDHIGEGGMGVVYLAERADGEYRGRVAIKILRAGHADTQLGTRFRDERQFLAALDHPCIVRLLDAGTTDDGLPYLVMERVEGVALTTYAADLPIRDCVVLVKRVAEALQYAHQKLIVHRDLKPGNILVTSDGTPKLLDFGIAKLLAPSDGLARETDTRTGMALLTFDYASPEQALGAPVTVASDVYSLGAVLYELLAGQPPQCSTGDTLERLRVICEVEPPRPSVVARHARREIAGDLDNIVAKALRKRPDERYGSAVELAEDLERYLTGRPVRARAATFGYRARKLVVRHRRAFALATLAVLALTTATIVSVAQARRADAETREAERQNRSLLETQGAQELERGEHARALPYLLEALRKDDTAATRFLIARALAPFERRLATADHRDGLLGVSRSPDRSTFYAGGPKGVRGYDDRGAPTGFAIGETETSGLVTADDTSVFIGSRDGREIQIYDRATSRRIGRLRSPILLERFDVSPHTVIAAGFHDLATCNRTAGTCQQRPPPSAYALGPEHIAFGEAGAIVLRTPAWEEIDRIELGRGDVIELAFAGADRLFAHAGTRLIAIDLKTRAVVSEHDGHVRGLVVSPDGTKLATVAADRTLRVWDTRSGELIVAMAGLNDDVRAIDWSADSARLATVGMDNRFRVWNARSGVEEFAVATTAPSGRLRGTMGTALNVAFSPDAKRLITSAATEIAWWDLEHSPRLAEATIDAFLYAASFSPVNERIFAVTGLGYVGLHELGAQPHWKHRVGRDQIYDVQWSPDGTRFVVAGANALARIYRTDGAVDRDLAGHTGTVNRATFSPDGTRIATASTDGTARIWNAMTGELRALLPGGDRVMSVWWTRDGETLVVATWGGTVMLYAAATLLPYAPLETGRQLLDASLSPDRSRVATAAHGGEIEIWDVASGRRLRSCEGHTGPATTVAWSPDGALLASSADDLTARIWDPVTCRRLAMMVHSGPIMQVMWSADGTRLWATNHDHRVVVWDVHREPRALAELEAIVARDVPWQLVDGQLHLR